ncbi:MAG: hypothetical protein IPK13_13740 [Deltaproteobacteria bacterium]|nr:hypothetical protein [Deltaproteobacteria bacterium]
MDVGANLWEAPGMPFCPSCRSEYRPGFQVCPPCGDRALVDALPEVVPIAEDEVDATVAIGVSTMSHVLEVGGRSVDLGRVFALKQAHAISLALEDKLIASVLVPVADLVLPDGAPRFEVRVRADDLDQAQASLHALWRDAVDAEGVEHADPEADVEACPACGARVPLDVEECPDCGLVIGRSDGSG